MALARIHSPAEDVRAAIDWPPLVDSDYLGEAAGKEAREHVNLDYAATTPSLAASLEAVLRVLPTYGSVHRGGGLRSRTTTRAYELARDQVGAFLDVPGDCSVVFVRNTTEAINLVAATLPEDARVLCTPFEHHANLLPWRSRRVDHLPFTETAAGLVLAAERALADAARAGAPYDVLAVTGASNVTGEVPALRRLVAAAHEAGTRVLVDAAQLAPHRQVSVRALGADFLAVSGHKLYAPFGAGALVIRRSALHPQATFIRGGGAVRMVGLESVAWAGLPHRLEAGTPNVLGAVALGAACEALSAWGLDRLEAAEHSLAERLWSALEALPGCTLLRLWPDAPDVVSVATFTVEGHDARALAGRLADEWGIAVRGGLFCAHPLVARLLGTPDELLASLAARAAAGEEIDLPGAVRASVGVGVQPEDVDALVEALTRIPIRA